MMQKPPDEQLGISYLSSRLGDILVGVAIKAEKGTRVFLLPVRRVYGELDIPPPLHFCDDSENHTLYHILSM